MRFPTYKSSLLDMQQKPKVEWMIPSLFSKSKVIQWQVNEKNNCRIPVKTRWDFFKKPLWGKLPPVAYVRVKYVSRFYISIKLINIFYFFWLSLLLSTTSWLFCLCRSNCVDCLHFVDVRFCCPLCLPMKNLWWKLQGDSSQCANFRLSLQYFDRNTTRLIVEDQSIVVSWDINW